MQKPWSLQSWFDVGPASKTLAQHETNIGWTTRTCRDQSSGRARVTTTGGSWRGKVNPCLTDNVCCFNKTIEDTGRCGPTSSISSGSERFEHAGDKAFVWRCFVSFDPEQHYHRNMLIRSSLKMPTCDVSSTRILITQNWAAVDLTGSNSESILTQRWPYTMTCLIASPRHCHIFPLWCQQILG